MAPYKLYVEAFPLSDCLSAICMWCWCISFLFCKCQATATSDGNNFIHGLYSFVYSNRKQKQSTTTKKIGKKEMHKTSDWVTVNFSSLTDNRNRWNENKVFRLSWIIFSTFLTAVFTFRSIENENRHSRCITEYSVLHRW